MASRKAVHPLRFKLITLGDIAVGKTSVIRQLCENRFFDAYHETVGVDYGMKRLLIADRNVILHFFDLSGNADYLHVRNEFYRDIHGVVLVYDTQSPQTFRNLQDWVEEITAAFPQPIYQSLVIAVCANKIDLAENNSTNDGKLWAVRHGFQYYEISALSGSGIQEAFQVTKIYADCIRLQQSCKNINPTKTSVH